MVDLTSIQSSYFNNVNTSNINNSNINPMAFDIGNINSLHNNEIYTSNNYGQHLFDEETIAKAAKTSKALKESKEITEIPNTIVDKNFDRNKTINILKLYVKEFPDKLKEYKNHKYDKMSDNELLELKEQFQYDVSSSSNVSFACEAAKKGLYMYEMIGCEVGLNIRGISNLSQNPEFNDCIKAICLKWISEPITCIQPENKLALMLFTNSLMLHQINSENDKKELPPSIVNNVPPVVPVVSVNKVKDIDIPLKTRLELRNLSYEYDDL